MAWGADTHGLEAARALASYQGDLIGVMALAQEIRGCQAACIHQVSPEQGRTHCWRCGADMARPALAKTRPSVAQLVRKVGT